MIWTLAFWKGAGERSLKTFIQTFTATQLANLAGAISAWEVDWGVTLQESAGVALLAAIFSLLMSLGNANFTAGTPLPAAGEPAELPPSNLEHNRDEVNV